MKQAFTKVLVRRMQAEKKATAEPLTSPQVSADLMHQLSWQRRSNAFPVPLLPDLQVAHVIIERLFGPRRIGFQRRSPGPPRCHNRQ